MKAARPVLLLGVLAVLIWVPRYFDSTQTETWGYFLALAVAALGLNVLTGYSGQVSIGHGAFFGLGAYITAILMSRNDWRWLATLPVVIVVLAVVGALIGFPALRVKGLYLALVTLAIAALFPQLVVHYVPGLVQGQKGATLVQTDPVITPGWAEGVVDKPCQGQLLFCNDQWRYYMALTTAIVATALVFNLVRGRFGRALIAVREQETAATTLGVNSARVKIAAFAISTALAGLGGAIWVLIKPGDAASYDNVSSVFQLSITLLLAVVVGGTATTSGPIIGAFFVVFFDEWGKDLISGKPQFSPLVFGVLLILLMYVLPDGIVGGARRLWKRSMSRSASRANAGAGAGH